MRAIDAAEYAYKNGYRKGYEDAMSDLEEALRNIKEKKEKKEKEDD